MCPLSTNLTVNSKDYRAIVSSWKNGGPRDIWVMSKSIRGKNLKQWVCVEQNYH